jgi:AcrR family transcriptional regulator
MVTRVSRKPKQKAADSDSASDTRGDKTRRQIKAVIAKLASKHDLADISLSDICKGTKLTTGAVYFHFKGKDEAVEEMVIDEVETMYARMLEPGHASFEEMARAIIAECAAYEQANGRRSRALQLVINSRPRAYEAWIGARSPVIERLTALIATARRGAGLAEDASPFLALFILNSIEDLSMDVFQWGNPTLRPFAEKPEDWIARQTALWSHAILAPIPSL